MNGRIKLEVAEGDDIAFLERVERIVNGAVAAMGMCEVFVVRVDNWFDHKWLRFWCWQGPELMVPPFVPSRIRDESRFIWNANIDEWERSRPNKPLHVDRPGRPTLAQPLDRFSKSAAFAWLSGNSVKNGRGSLMLYASGADEYSWYASFVKKDDAWSVHDGFRITRQELDWFEERARQAEMA